MADPIQVTDKTKQKTELHDRDVRADHLIGDISSASQRDAVRRDWSQVSATERTRIEAQSAGGLPQLTIGHTTDSNQTIAMITNDQKPGQVEIVDGSGHRWFSSDGQHFSDGEHQRLLGVQKGADGHEQFDRSGNRIYNFTEVPQSSLSPAQVKQQAEALLQASGAETTRFWNDPKNTQNLPAEAIIPTGTFNTKDFEARLATMSADERKAVSDYLQQNHDFTLSQLVGYADKGDQERLMGLVNRKDGDLVDQHADQIHSKLAEFPNASYRQQAETERYIRDTLRETPPDQLAKLQDGFQQKFGVSLKDYIAKSGMSDKSKETLAAYLDPKLSREQRSTQLAEVALKYKDLDLWKEAMKDAPSSVHQAFLSDANQQRIKQAFTETQVMPAGDGTVATYEDATKADQALECARAGQLSTATLVLNASDRPQVEQALQNMTEDERRQFTIGRAIAGGSQLDQVLTPVEKKLYEQGKNLADHPGSGTPDQAASDFYARVNGAQDCYKSLHGELSKQSSNDTDLASLDDKAERKGGSFVSSLQDLRHTFWNTNVNDIRAAFGNMTKEQFDDLRAHPERAGEFEHMLGTITTDKKVQQEMMDLYKAKMNAGDAKWTFEQSQHTGGPTLDQTKAEARNPGEVMQQTASSIEHMSPQDQQSYRDGDQQYRQQVRDHLKDIIGDRPELLRATYRMLDQIANGQQPKMDLAGQMALEFDPDKAAKLMAEGFAKDPKLGELVRKPADQRTAAENEMLADLSKLAHERLVKVDVGDGNAWPIKDYSLVKSVADPILKDGHVPPEQLLQIHHDDPKQLAKDLLAMSKEDRDAALASDTFKKGFSQEQQQILSNVAQQGAFKPEDQARAAIIGWGDGDLTKILTADKSQFADIKKAYIEKYGSLLENDVRAKLPQADADHIFGQNLTQGEVIDRMRAEFARTHGSAGAGLAEFFGDNSGEQSKERLNELVKQYKDFQEKVPGATPEQFIQMQQRLGDAVTSLSDAVKLERTEIAKTSEEVAQAAVMGVSLFSGGAGVPLMFAMAGSSALMKVALKKYLQGDDYDDRNANADAITGFIDGMAGGLGGKLLGIGSKSVASVMEKLGPDLTKALGSDSGQFTAKLQQLVKEGIDSGRGVNPDAIESLVREANPEADATAVAQQIRTSLDNEFRFNMREALSNEFKVAAKGSGIGAGQGTADGIATGQSPEDIARAAAMGGVVFGGIAAGGAALHQAWSGLLRSGTTISGTTVAPTDTAPNSVIVPKEIKPVVEKPLVSADVQAAPAPQPAPAETLKAGTDQFTKSQSGVWSRNGQELPEGQHVETFGDKSLRIVDHDGNVVEAYEGDKHFVRQADNTIVEKSTGQQFPAEAKLTGLPGGGVQLSFENLPNKPYFKFGPNGEITEGSVGGRVFTLDAEGELRAPRTETSAGAIVPGKPTLVMENGEPALQGFNTIEAHARFPGMGSDTAVSGGQDIWTYRTNGDMQEQLGDLRLVMSKGAGNGRYSEADLGSNHYRMDQQTGLWHQIDDAGKDTTLPEGFSISHTLKSDRIRVSSPDSKSAIWYDASGRANEVSVNGHVFQRTAEGKLVDPKSGEEMHGEPSMRFDANGKEEFVTTEGWTYKKDGTVVSPEAAVAPIPHTDPAPVETTKIGSDEFTKAESGVWSKNGEQLPEGAKVEKFGDNTVRVVDRDGNVVEAYQGDKHIVRQADGSILEKNINQQFPAEAQLKGLSDGSMELSAGTAPNNASFKYSPAGDLSEVTIGERNFVRQNDGRYVSSTGEEMHGTPSIKFGNPPEITTSEGSTYKTDGTTVHPEALPVVEPRSATTLDAASTERSAAVQTQVQSAEKSVAAASEQAAAANKIVGDSQAKLDTLRGEAEHLQGQAKEDATRAVNDAEQKLAAARQAADDAKVKAEEAQKAADEAKRAADDQKVDLETKERLATEAQEKAEQAKRAAEEAERQARESQAAIDTAESKMRAPEKAADDGQGGPKPAPVAATVTGAVAAGVAGEEARDVTPEPAKPVRTEAPAQAPAVPNDALMALATVRNWEGPYHSADRVLRAVLGRTPTVDEVRALTKAFQNEYKQEHNGKSITEGGLVHGDKFITQQNFQGILDQLKGSPNLEASLKAYVQAGILPPTNIPSQRAYPSRTAVHAHPAPAYR